MSDFPIKSHRMKQMLGGSMLRSDSDPLGTLLQRRHLLIGASALGAASPLIPGRGAAAAPAASAMRCADFLDTLAVNTHISYTDGQYADVDLVLRALRYVRLRHVRDSPPHPEIDATWRGHYDRVARAGLHFNFGVDAQKPPAHMIEVCRNFARRHPNVEFTIEGPNEVNNWPVTFEGRRGDEAAVAYQAALYRMVKDTPELRGRTVISATGMLLASDGDWANYHSYPWNGEQPYATFEREQKKQTEAMSGRPVVLTETGYYTLPGDTKAWGGVDEATQAKLILNLYLDALRLGSVRTYVYQLLDAYPDPEGGNSEHHFGLFRLDGSPKPSATAIRNLTGLMQDPAPDARTFAPRDLAHGIEGMPLDGASLLLAHSSGEHRLILWNQARIWDKDGRRAVTPDPVRVRVRLTGGARRVELHDPLRGEAPFRIADGADRVEVELTGSPVILRIR